MTKRTDTHRPSAIEPQDYEYVAEEYMKIEDLGDAIAARAQRERIQEHMAQTGGTYAQVETAGNCMVCGSVNAQYTSLFYHAKSNTYVRMGHDCADKCELGGEFERNKFRKAVQDAREYIAGKRKAQALLSDAGLLAAWDIYGADYDALPKTGALPERKDEFGGTLPAYAGQVCYEEQTIRDIVGKLVKYGSISEKAQSFLKSLVERIPRREQIAAERKAEKDAAAPCPTGRVTVTGTVLKVAEHESAFGVVDKMTVKADEGYIVWVTVPRSAAVERGNRVRFVATITPSDRDNKFGFGKRPSKLEVIETTKESN